MRIFTVVAWCQCMCLAAVGAIYIEEPLNVPPPDQMVFPTMDHSDVTFRPSDLSALLGGVDFSSLGSGDPDMVRRLQMLKIKLERLKNYLCSSFYTVTCRTLRHYQRRLADLEKKSSQRVKARPARSDTASTLTFKPRSPSWRPGLAAALRRLQVRQALATAWPAALAERRQQIMG